MNLPQPEPNNSDTSDVIKRIFALRKQGKLREAFDLLCTVLPAGYPQNQLIYYPNNWLYIAAQTVLIDLCKYESSVNPPNMDNLNFLKNYISGLNSGGDEKQQKGIDYALRLCSKANPSNHLIEEYRQIPFKTDNAHACELLWKYRMETGDCYYDNDLAWRIYFCLRDFLDHPPVDIFNFKKILNHYFKLDYKRIKNWPTAHKCILIIANKFHKYLETKNESNQFKYVNFVKIWDPANFEPEDWIKKPEDQYPPLAVTSISHVAKDLAGKGKILTDTDLVHTFMPYIDRIIAQDPNEIWLRLYKARIEVKLNKFDVAQENMLQVLQKNSDASWAWSELAAIVRHTDPAMAKPCYCRALLSKNKDEFKVNIHRDFSSLLLEQNDLEHAKRELEIYYQLNAKAVPLDISIPENRWYDQCASSNHHEEYYQEFAGDADNLLYADVPEFVGVMGQNNAYTDSNTHKLVKNRQIYISVPDQNPPDVPENCPLCTSVKEGKLNLEQYQSGDPVYVKGVFSTDQHRFKVLSVRKRVDNDKDILITLAGIIDQINPDRHNAHLINSKKFHLNLPLDMLDADLQQLGKPVVVKIAYRQERDRIQLVPIALAGTVELQDLPEDLYKNYSGKISIIEHAKIGFVGKNIFVGPGIIEKYKLENRQMISGLAVLSFNRKKNTWGMSALTVSQTTPNQDVTGDPQKTDKVSNESG